MYVFLHTMPEKRKPGELGRTWTNREPPAYFKDTWRWLAKETGDPHSAIAFSRAILDGTAIDPEGRPIDAMPRRAAKFLERFKNHPDAGYELGRIVRDHELKDWSIDWLWIMDDAAQCGSEAAMWDIVVFWLDAERGSLPFYSAMSWLWVLSDRGYDVANEISRGARKHGVSGDRQTYEKAITLNNTIPEYCQTGDGP